MSSAISPLIAVIPGSFLAIGCLIGALFSLRKKRIIDDLPTSKTQGVFIGLSELKGTAESDNPLRSQLAEMLCVQYSWQVDEQWSRTVTETYHDSKGTHTRTRIETGWTKIAGGGNSIPFYLKDDVGLIRIIPDGAQIQGTSAMNTTCGRGDPLYYGKGPSAAVANSAYKRRFHETAVPLHAMLYVLGQAREREDLVAAEIAFDKKAPIFIISVRTEKQISRAYGIGFGFWFALGIFISAGAGIGWSLLSWNTLNWQPLVVMLAGYLLVFLVSWLWTTYNSLIGLHHQAERAWSQVDVQLKRRDDLIPNLVQAIEGFKQYERETQQTLAEIRSRVSSPQVGAIGTAVKGLVPLLRIMVEHYPDLKASESFLKLQNSLVDTEQRIALARDYYNSIATFYNTRLEIIPQRYVAVIARLIPDKLLEATDLERAPVKVQLVT